MLPFIVSNRNRSLNHKMCSDKEALRIEMPKEKIIKFKNVQHLYKVPFEVYIDFECYAKLLSLCIPCPNFSYVESY